MILNVFKTGINAVSCSPVFQAVFLVFSTAQWRLRHTGSSDLALVFDYNLYWRIYKASLLALYINVITHCPTSTKLLSRDFLRGPCHCSYIFVVCLDFPVHVAGDLNKKISFVVGVLSTLLACALLGLIHYSPSCPM